MKSKGELDPISLVFLLMMIGMFLLTCTVMYGLMYGNAMEKAFCPQGLKIGRGSISYCDGKPFVCSEEYCSYLNNQVLGEECISHGFLGGQLDCTPILGGQ